uniref:At2g24240-like C-terminal beta-propeller domain-containing protein n=1 Tax=Oryza glumipatula TaxID=40148 RepID=A0A0E0AT22_9ORYZ
MIIRPQSAIGGIGVWDCTTGEQADFFYEPPGCALGDADKLQWLDGTSTLMAATMFPRTDTSFIILLDFRDKKNVAWSWSDVGTPALLEDKNVLHAIAMEDGRQSRVPKSGVTGRLIARSTSQGRLGDEFKLRTIPNASYRSGLQGWYFGQNKVFESFHGPWGIRNYLESRIEMMRLCRGAADTALS